MIDRLRRMIRGPDPVENLISAYLDVTSDIELEGVEQRLRAAGVDVDELRTVPETAQLLRSLDTIEAPRSFALTPETLTDQGYSEAETDRILNPRSTHGGFRLRNAGVYVPLAIAAVALAGVALLTVGDLSEYVTERFDSEETIIQTVVVEKEVQSADAAIASTLGEPGPVQTIVVEKEVIVVHTVIVEKQVQVAGETVIQTVEVEKIVEKEVVVEVEKLVEIEKIVEVEREVVVEVEVEKEVIREVETLPTPVAARAEMTAEAMTMLEAADHEPDPTPIPTDIPCAILPTATPTPTGSPVASTTPEPTATMSPIPTCTPTPTPSPTPTATPTPAP